MELSDRQIEEVIDYIQGSCMRLDQAIYDVTEGVFEGLEDVTNWQQLCASLDNAHFLCSVCGWWNEAGNYAEGEDDVCTDCGPEEDKDD